MLFFSCLPARNDEDYINTICYEWAIKVCDYTITENGIGSFRIIPLPVVSGKNCTHLWPAVAFQIHQQLLGDANDIETSAEAIDVDPIVIDLHLVASLPKCFQLQSRSGLAITCDSLKDIKRDHFFR